MSNNGSPVRITTFQWDKQNIKNNMDKRTFTQKDLYCERNVPWLIYGKHISTGKSEYSFRKNMYSKSLMKLRKRIKAQQKLLIFQYPVISSIHMSSDRQVILYLTGERNIPRLMWRQGESYPTFLLHFYKGVISTPQTHDV